MQTWFPCFLGIDLHGYSTVIVCMGNFLLVRPVDKWRKQLAVKFYSSWYIMRSGVGILARQIRLAMARVVEPYYILQLKSYGFDQVILIVWIKFFSFKKHFSFLSLTVTWIWRDILIYIGNMHFPVIYSMQNFKIFYPLGPIMVRICAKLTLVNIYRIFSRYNFEKLIRTLSSMNSS